MEFNCSQSRHLIHIGLLNKVLITITIYSKSLHMDVGVSGDQRCRVDDCWILCNTSALLWQSAGPKKWISAMDAVQIRVLCDYIWSIQSSAICAVNASNECRSPVQLIYRFFEVCVCCMRTGTLHISYRRKWECSELCLWSHEFKAVQRDETLFFEFYLNLKFTLFLLADPLRPSFALRPNQLEDTMEQSSILVVD